MFTQLSKLSINDTFFFSDNRNKRFKSTTEYQVLNKYALGIQFEKTPVKPDGKVIELDYNSRYFDMFVSIPETVKF